MIAAGVGEADEIEPVHRHPLAEVGRRQQPTHDLLVRIRRLVGDERIDLFRRRRQTDEIERQSANESPPIGLGRRGATPSFSRAGEEEAVDRVLDPSLVLDLRRLGPGRGDERPVLLVLRPLLDPLLDDSELLRGDGLVRLGRRHLLARLVPDHAEIEIALHRPARHEDADPLAAIAVDVGIVVEPEVPLAMRLVGSVAQEAVVRQDGANVAIELDRGGRQRHGRKENQRRGDRCGSREHHRLRHGRWKARQAGDAFTLVETVTGLKRRGMSRCIPALATSIRSAARTP